MSTDNITVINQVDNSCNCGPDDSCFCEAELQFCDICNEALEKMITRFLSDEHENPIYICHSCQELSATKMAVNFIQNQK